jgi:chaperonin GroES
MDFEFDKVLDSANIAEMLEEEQLNKIGDDVVEGYLLDEDSRIDWMDRYEEYVKLAAQIKEDKTFPWPKAANIKYPLLSTASLQFAARAYPALVPDRHPVKGKVTGADPDGAKAQKAHRIGNHMSYQILEQMEGWEEDMDRLTFILPIAGTVFKKTYRDSMKNKNVSDLVLPDKLAVNYWAPCLEKAQRITHILEVYPNDVISRKNAGIFLDIDLGEPQPMAKTPVSDIVQGTQDTSGSSNPDFGDRPYTFLEQHTFLDLDEDGYKEPYVVTVELESRKVVRIVARFDSSGVRYAEDNKKIIEITPVQYFTKFSFIPNPDGGFYDLGFGLLLGSLNDTANTLINQLLDAGTLSNLQGGFLGKGLRIKGGVTSFQPGEWKTVQSTGDDLRKSIVPLPTKDPSPVLFQLLTAIVQSGKELASVAEIMTGKMPGQNTPATTTMASIEQGLKVFSAIFKRIYRSLTKEYKKLYRLNSIYLDQQEYFLILDENGAQQTMQVSVDDYRDDGTDVSPNAHESNITDTQKLMRAQVLMQLMGTGMLNPLEVVKEVLSANGINDFQRFIMQAQPQQDPKQQEMQMKAQMDQQSAAMKMQMEQEKMKLKQQEMELKLQIEGLKAQLEEQKAQNEMRLAQEKHSMEIRQSQEKHQQESFNNKMRSDLDIMNTAQTHQEQMRQMREKERNNGGNNKGRVR